MNQIKYLMRALLLLCCLAAGIYFFNIVRSVKPVEENTSVVIDYVATKREPVSEVAVKGKSLFQQNCQSCHSPDKNLTGPALRGFTNRGLWTEKENIYKWIKDPAAFMKKDVYTNALKDEFGVMMPAFSHLTKGDIDAIVEYINTPVPGY